MAKKSSNKSCAAITLVELLVVLATVALLAITILPAVAASRPASRVLQCGNNLRQLSTAWILYTQDRLDSPPQPSTLVSLYYLDWSSASQNTNQSLLTDSSVSPIWNYVKGPVSVFKCPADTFQSPANPGPRIRSYSINAFIGGKTTIFNQIPGRNYNGLLRMGDLASSGPPPSNIFLWLDEHPDSINDAIFQLNAGCSIASEKWRDLPASYHNGGCNISFIDGHYETHKWNNIPNHTAVRPVKYNFWASDPQVSALIGPCPDYEWLDDRLPYR